MTKLIFTRFLYIFDEVCLSLLSSLIKKKSIDEAYFWASEIYLSGFIQQSWQLIWFIYFDFYYINSPYFYKYIIKKQSQNDMKGLLSVIKNIYKLKPSSQIFITRQYNSSIKEINHIFKGKKPNWLKPYPVKYHGFLRFLDKKLYHYAVSSLPDLIDDEFITTIKQYFKITDDDISVNFDNTLNMTEYDNNIHKVWSIISLYIFNPDYSKKQPIYTTITKNEYDAIIDHDTSPIPLSPKYNNPQIYKTLEYKRKYHIDPFVSSFHLLRDSVDNICNEMWYSWEYHAYSTPIWKERFDKYKIIINSDKRKIEFMDDDEIELFYETYCYDPDEQSTETQNKALSVISDNNWNKWYNNLFNDISLFEFNNDFKFSY